jgi:hypothetical protein
MGEMRNAYIIFIRNPFKSRLLEKPSGRWEESR